jgi:cell wall-associated NlpC family hydrolase
MPTSALTAVQKMQLSQLNPNQIQREMMGDDIDLQKLSVYLKGALLFDSTDRIVDLKINRAIDGASTVDLTLNDYDRTIIKSWAINAKLDINIDGIWFRLVKVAKAASEDNLVMTFEQREIALLREYPKPNTQEYTYQNAKKWIKWAYRSHTTRAEFILNLIREVKEVKIPVVIPHLHQVQEIVTNADVGGTTGSFQNNAFVGTGGGISLDYNTSRVAKKAKPKHPTGWDGIAGAASDAVAAMESVAKQAGILYAKTARMDRAQITNANTILRVGQSMGARRKVLVCAIMTAIDESVLYNLAGGDRDSVGLFQQRDSWGSYADRHDPATAARLFYQQAIPYDKEWPNVSFNDLCQAIQRSGTPDAYGQWRDHAERIASAFGVPPGGESGVTGGTVPGNDPSYEGSAASANNQDQTAVTGTADSGYFYYRGIPPTRNRGWWKREDNWTCIKRLADEVQWRAFFISGVFYFLTDDDLLKTQPIATVTEESQGVMGIGFDYDVGKPAATVDIPCQVGLWLAPPGSVIVIDDLGPISGRWLVNTFARSLFESNADVNLTKKQPKLMEPGTESAKLPTWAAGSGAGSSVAGEGSPNQAQFGGIPGINNNDRASVVAVAKRALQIEKSWHYDYAHPWETGIHAPRPIPDTLWSQDAHNRLDCSSFAILVYKEAGCDDPSGNNYNGTGYTGDIARHGMPVNVAQPGDLVLYGSPPDYEHVAVYIGNGQNIEIGGDQGVHQEPTNGSRGPTYRSFLSL